MSGIKEPSKLPCDVPLVVCAKTDGIKFIKKTPFNFVALKNHIKQAFQTLYQPIISTCHFIFTHQAFYFHSSAIQPFYFHSSVICFHSGGKPSYFDFYKKATRNKQKAIKKKAFGGYLVENA